MNSSAQSSQPTVVELVFANPSGYAVSFVPQIVLITPAANGSATLNAANLPVNVPAGASDSSVSVALAPAAGQPVTVTLQLDGAVGGTAFSMIQVFGVAGDSTVPTGYN